MNNFEFEKNKLEKEFEKEAIKKEVDENKFNETEKSEITALDNDNNIDSDDSDMNESKDFDDSDLVYEEHLNSDDSDLKLKDKVVQTDIKTSNQLTEKKEIDVSESVLISYKSNNSKSYKEFETIVKNIIDLSEFCVECGMCRHACPIYEVFLSEDYSPRSKNKNYSSLVKDKTKGDYNNVSLKDNDEVILRLKDLAYKCSLCNNCYVRCPLKINLKDLFRDFRAFLVKTGNEVPEHKEMIENIRKYGNPFGDKPKSDKFYCC